MSTKTIKVLDDFCLIFEGKVIDDYMIYDNIEPYKVEDGKFSITSKHLISKHKVDSKIHYRTPNISWVVDVDANTYFTACTKNVKYICGIINGPDWEYDIIYYNSALKKWIKI